MNDFWKGFKLMKPEDNEVFCIAYGSNLDETRMKQRCPSAELFGTSVIGGYRLLFRDTSVMMGYLNVIMHYGIERFCQSCVECGASGAIIPDLPFKDYMDEVKPIADKYDLRIIMMITPETSEERIRFIDEHTDGFIYMVSSASITGAQKSFDEAKQEYFRHINGMNLRNPRMIGFGISNKQTLESAQQNAAGAIIGSKFVTLLNEANGDAEKAIDNLYEALKS